MIIEANEVFAVEIDSQVYHLGCRPSDADISAEDLIMRGDEERNDLYFCDDCGKQII
jgi:hypothetical protein